MGAQGFGYRVSGLGYRVQGLFGFLLAIIGVTARLIRDFKNKRAFKST